MLVLLLEWHYLIYSAKIITLISVLELTVNLVSESKIANQIKRRNPFFLKAPDLGRFKIKERKARKLLKCGLLIKCAEKHISCPLIGRKLFILSCLFKHRRIPNGAIRPHSLANSLIRPIWWRLWREMSQLRYWQ